MRKLILASVMMLMATAFSFGQMDIGFGPKIGLNLTNMTNSNMRIKPGIVVGAFANMRINDYLGVQPEILFSMQGTKKNDYTLKMNYSILPDLKVGNDNSQIAVANADRNKFEIWIKMYREDMIKQDKQPGNIYEMDNESYMDTAAVNEDEYIDNASFGISESKQ